MAIAPEEGMTAADIRAANAALAARRAATAATPRTKTTAEERGRESGQMYGSGNAAPAVGVGPTPAVPAVVPPSGRKVKSTTYRGSGLERIMVVTYDNGDVEETPAPVTALPGATGGNLLAPERVLASDTFKNTFALAFGADEASKPYVTKLYNIVASFYKTGSTIDESINLAVRKARVDNEVPEFTQRFKGLFALDDMLKAGKLVKVPTVAEYIASENQVAELLNNAGMSAIANSEVIGTALGKGKSVSEIGRILSGAFAAIDNAPEPFKKVLSEKFPTVTRIGLAQALIGGAAGAAELDKEIKNLGVIASARQQGVNITAEQAANIANLNYDYQSSLSGMATVAQTQGTYQKLAEIETGQKVKDAATKLTGAVFGKNAEDISAIDAMTQRELNRFKGSAGRLASKDRSQGLI